jgi:hypothetical protein
LLPTTAAHSIISLQQFTSNRLWFVGFIFHRTFVCYHRIIKHGQAVVNRTGLLQVELWFGWKSLQYSIAEQMFSEPSKRWYDVVIIMGKTRLRTFIIGDTFLSYMIPYDFTWYLTTRLQWRIYEGGESGGTRPTPEPLQKIKIN